MARIDFKWAEPKLNTYDHINTEDFFTALPADYKADGKPLLIYVTSKKTEDAQEMANIEGSVLKDESISIGATMFRSVKLDGAKINEGHPFWKTLGGKELPRMIVVDAAGQKVGMCEGKQVSSSKVFGFMERAAARTFKTDLGTVVKETKTILTEIDQVEAKRKALETRKTAAKNDHPEKYAKEEKELDAAMKAIEDREKSLRVKWEAGKVTKA
jgi:hypothetical protein